MTTASDLIGQTKHCLVEACDRAILARSLCRTHYQRLMKHGTTDGRGRTPAPKAPCIAEGCDRTALAKSLCGLHYKRMAAHGDLTKGDPLPPLYRALKRLIWMPSGCWEWAGSRTVNGYGKMTVGVGPDRRQTVVHRVVYEALVGAVPAGLDLDHLCRNRACANPVHLEPVTRSENLRRGIGGRYYPRKAVSA